MLDHVSITVDDMARARPFYEAVMAALGVPCVGIEADWLGCGLRSDEHQPERSYLSIRLGPAGSVPGRHWAFRAQTRAAVDAFWAAGVAHGGLDDGEPGLRRHYHRHYYAAFLVDPAGNRIEAVCHRTED